MDALSFCKRISPNHTTKTVGEAGRNAPLSFWPLAEQYENMKTSCSPD